MFAAIVKKYFIEIIITAFNFLLVCFAVDFRLNIQSALQFGIYYNYVEINYLLYFLISTLMLLAFNAVLYLLRSLAAINITMKIIATICILFPLCALLISIFMVYGGHDVALSNNSLYLQGLFFMISVLMIFWLVQIYIPVKGK